MTAAAVTGQLLNPYTFDNSAIYGSDVIFCAHAGIKQCAIRSGALNSSMAPCMTYYVHPLSKMGFVHITKRCGMHRTMNSDIRFTVNIPQRRGIHAYSRCQRPETIGLDSSLPWLPCVSEKFSMYSDSDKDCSIIVCREHATDSCNPARL